MHPLDGPRAKVERAVNHIQSLQDDWLAFFGLEENTYRIVVAERDQKTGNYSLRVQDAPASFPDSWGVIIGEIAHDLRSALDGLVWQLALLDNLDPYRFTAFPICRVGLGKRRRKGGGWHRPFWTTKNTLLHLLNTVDKKFWTSIAGFQPYKGGNGGRFSPLFLLEELNNADKHRLLTIVTTVPARFEMSGYWGGGSSIKRGVTLHLNAKVGEVPPLPPSGITVFDPEHGGIKVEHDVKVETTVTPGILFGNSCDAVKRLPVIRTLRSMANEVSRVIESFTDKFPIQ